MRKRLFLPAAGLLAAISTLGYQGGPGRTPQPRYRSKLAIFDLKDRSTKVVHTSDDLFEAPNWSRDGKFLLINSRGSLFTLPAEGGKPERLALDASFRCNNDHDYSRDGKWLAISASTPSERRSRVYVAGADGAGPRLLTPASPSYFHGWSPDGKWLSFVGQRNGNFNLFRVAFEGGEEQRLTSHPGYDDGPDYSPNGKWIYFNSSRAGGWDIWRIPESGAGPGDALAQRVTSDPWEDWFPHLSPNGKHIVFLSFPPGTENHDGKMEIQLRMMRAPGKEMKRPKIETLTTIFGGQGTINVNSWAPDSRRFAFVIYEEIPGSR
ncbi:MAG: TolB family protein [Bryobacterales bacterium]|nr:TolB family protein [Bryobacterales bacterium]